MNIRSLTGFCSLDTPLRAAALDPFRALLDAARGEFAQAGFPLQTTRVATQPITEIAPPDLVAFARDLQAAIRTQGIEYAALGAPRADHPLAPLDLVDEIPAAIAATQDVFASLQIASF